MRENLNYQNSKPVNLNTEDPALLEKTKETNLCQHGNLKNNCPICGEQQAFVTAETEDILQKDKTAGMPEVKLSPTFEAYADSQWSEYKSEIESNNDYQALLEDVGLDSRNITLKKWRVKRLDGSDEEILEIESDYAEGIKIKQFLSSIKKTDRGYTFDDIVFVDEKTDKIFSLKSLMPEDVNIYINPELKYKAWGSNYSVEIPPPSRDYPPEEPLQKLLWPIYKKIEPLVMLHEVGHSRQKFGVTTEEGVKAERDAWRFALQAIRQLRQKGVELLPGISNDQIFSRLELGLLRYDSKHPENLPKRYSDTFNKSSAEINHERTGLTHDFEHILYFIRDVIKTAIKDPSLIADTLRYKK